MNFYSRPRVGGDQSFFEIQDRVAQISTHAPAWGATHLPKGSWDIIAISTHAPAWGATPEGLPPVVAGDRFLLTPPRGGRPRSMVRLLLAKLFLLTPPRGGRHRGTKTADKVFAISTHAPAWGATYAAFVEAENQYLFLLTPPRGGRRQFFTSTRQVCDTNCRKIHSNSNFLSICPCDF